MAELSIADLAQIQPDGLIVAHRALYVSACAFTRLGHDVNLYTERAWKGLNNLAQHKVRARAPLRCMQCNALGTLEEWYLMLSSCCGKWPQYCASLDPKHTERLAQMEQPCDQRVLELDLAALEIDWTGGL